MDPKYTLSVVTENETSALLRLATCLARHRVEIESFTCAAGDQSDLYRHTVVVRAHPDRIRRAIKQIGACVGVLSVHYQSDGATVDREVALYKLSVDASAVGNSLQKLVRSSRARILVAGQDYVVVEKTGHGDEIQELFENLEPFGVTEFVRSGRVMVTKSQPTSVAG